MAGRPDDWPRRVVGTGFRQHTFHSKREMRCLLRRPVSLLCFKVGAVIPSTGGASFAPSRGGKEFSARANSDGFAHTAD